MIEASFGVRSRMTKGKEAAVDPMIEASFGDRSSAARNDNSYDPMIEASFGARGRKQPPVPKAVAVTVPPPMRSASPATTPQPAPKADTVPAPPVTATTAAPPANTSLDSLVRGAWVGRTDAVMVGQAILQEAGRLSRQGQPEAMSALRRDMRQGERNPFSAAVRAAKRVKP